MKKLLLLTSITLTSYLSAQSWAYSTLDINQVNAGVNSNGDLFWNFATAVYEVPRDSGTHTIFAATNWIGGLDSSGALHLGAQTYRQSGNDFYPGPVMNASAYSSATDAQWNKVWKINKTTIDSFLMWRANPGNFPSYVIPGVIATWPGNGNVADGQAAQLAPYIDADADGVYNPNAGDYPCIKGDQAIFIMFNDDRNTHGETGGAKMKIEVHAMVYAYSAPGTWLDTTVFVNYKLYNRSGSTYSDAYWGQWTDYDIGYYGDDYVGCDVERHLGYAYNGDADDGFSPVPSSGTYGANPPAQGVVVLKGPEADSGDGVDNDRDGIVDELGETCRMSHHVTYVNSFNVTGNPQEVTDYYGYMDAFWPDSSPVTYGGNGYGGTTLCDFMYPGDSDPLNWGTNFIPQPVWDEAIVGNSPGDRRSLVSSGPFTFEPGSEECLDFAYVFGRGTNGPMSGAGAMRFAADSAYSFYQNNNPCTCDENPLNVQSHQSSLVGIYPNPANESVNIICGENSTGSTVEIVDVNGKVVKTATVLSGNSVVVNTEDLAAGVYFVRVNKGSVVLSGRFIRN